MCSAFLHPKSLKLQIPQTDHRNFYSIPAMNPPISDPNPSKMKKIKLDADRSGTRSDVLMDENLIFEVLKHVDGRTLAMAACVSKQWNRTAQDERLWELMCAKDGSRHQQQQRRFRSVVLALGGFRRFYSLHLWPLVKRSFPHAPPQAWPGHPAAPPAAKIGGKSRPLGKDEMNLSLSLFSIQYFASLNSANWKKKQA